MVKFTNYKIGIMSCSSIARCPLSLAGRRLLQRTARYGPGTSFLRFLLLFLLSQFIIHNPAFPQQPQAQAGQQIFPVNAKFVQGVGPGYWPTAGSNLTLNLAPGTAVCSNTVQTYAGGALTLAPSATNYVYLDPSQNCAPASNTTGFKTASIPIATVVTTSTAIASLSDVRTMFVSGGATGSGSVTSVGMAGDGIIFSPAVSGSPITSSGSLAPQLLTQTANAVLAGPGSGPAATPTFRALASADLPATISSNTTGNAATATALASSPTQCGSNNWATGITAQGNANCLQPGFSSISGSATVSQGGTGQTTASAAFNALSPLTTEGDLQYYHSSSNARLGVGTNNQCLTSNGTDPVWGSCSTGSGTVTSVGLSLPSLFSVSGSPVTQSGTLTATFANQNSHLILAGPSSGSAAAPTFRALVGADLPAPTPSSLGGVESLSCTTGQFLNQISTAGAPSCATPTGGGSGLGNGTTVIDASLQAGTEFGSKVNAALQLCPSAGCTIDARGFASPQTMSVSITLPANVSVWLPAATITRSTGVQFILNSGDRIHGDSSGATQIASANTTNDYSPVFQPAASGGNTSSDVEIDHLQIGATTPSGPPLAITSISSGSACSSPYTGNCNTFSGTITGGAGNAYAGMKFYVFAPPSATTSSGYSPTNWSGYGICTASTSTTLTLQTTTYPLLSWAGTGVTANLIGAWGIDGPFIYSNFHDIAMYGTDLGIGLEGSGCNCYNQLWNLDLVTQHGALYFGDDANANTGWGIEAWATDQAKAGFANAIGYGVYFDGYAYQNTLTGLDIENTRYSVLVFGYNDYLQIGIENDYALAQGAAASSTLPTLEPGAYNNTISGAVAVLDISANQSNVYGTHQGARDLNPNRYGSTQILPVASPNVCGTSVGAGSGSTLIKYFFVFEDYNGNTTLPLECDVTNQTLGPYTLPLSSVVASGGVNTYTGTISGGASNGLAGSGNSFTITGFAHSGNNITCTPTATTSTTLTCTAPAGVTETASASAASTAYNLLSASTSGNTLGEKCMDILKGDTSHSLATCVQYASTTTDNGSIALQPYTAPTRNATGDFYVPGKLSTSNNTLDDGSGNMNVANQMSAQQFCFTTNCITSWPATPSLPLSIANGGTGNTTGTAATATALAAFPAQCPGFQFAVGIAANGNANCATPSGSGGGSATFQVNGTTTPTQSVINFINGTYLTASNPSAGQVKFDISSLPAPTSSTLGGIESIAQNANNWIQYIDTSGVPHLAQPGFSNLSGSLAASQTPLTINQDILFMSGAALGRLPISIVGSGQCLGNNSGTWGNIACSTGSAATFEVNGSNTANQTTINFTNGTYLTASNPSAGQVKFDIASLPSPTASTLGGIESLAAVSHKWINAISTGGIPSATQPASTDLSDYGSFPGAAFGSQSANSFHAAPNGSSGYPSFRAIVAADLPAALSNTTSVNGTTIPSGGVTLTQTIASGTVSLATSSISSGTCASVVTATATNVATTDVVMAGFNGDPTSTTGYVPSTSGMLTIIAYPTSGNVNFKVCNNTGAAITPGSVTLNWRVTR